MLKKVAIIGGGAAGMMAAVSVSKKGNNVTIFEKNEKLGKKILLTGNGRCNITNSNVNSQNYHGKYPKFSASVLSQFTNKDTIKFFEDLGLVLKEEDNGRLFPRSNQAQSVIDCFEEKLKELKVTIKYNQKIKDISKKNNKFIITTYQNKNYEFNKLIIATGGKTYPNTGSTGDGYRFAKNFGHKIIKPFPVSAPFRIKSVICNKLQGIKVNAKLTIFHNDKKLVENTGELLFTHLGISAPVVLESSREVSRILSGKPDENITCSINLLPEYNLEELFKLLNSRIKRNLERTLGNQFMGILPKKVAPVILKYHNINPDLKSSNVSKQIIHKTIQTLTNYKEKILSVLGWESAQFTAGGVDVSEINSKTMESKIVKDLYFCGEVIDIDGDSGGYNLQWAWSSGYVAGKYLGN